MEGKLYLVATPIGNLEDITLRAIRVLKEADIIVAEDVRHTLKLLNHLQIVKPLISFHRHSSKEKSEEILNHLKAGKDIALVSDAGTPIISDPGEEIVKKAIENNITVIPIPGACACISGLICSGLDAKEFIFIGFLPQNKKLRKQKLEEIQKANKTTILYEAPHKILETLQDLENVTETRKIVIAREMTKIHEEILRGTANELIEKLNSPKGEMVLLIEKNEFILSEEEQSILTLNNLSLQEHYEYYKKLGHEKKEIIKKIAKDRKVSKDDIYKNFI